MTIEKISSRIGNHDFIIETGRMAKQASGAVTVQCGGTVILAAVVAADKADPSKDFFPLMVDYRERTYAAGKIPGGFFKREGRPSEKEILTSRLIDRPIRSLFSNDYLNEVQITLTVLSTDGEVPTEIPAMIAASSALCISDIPFEKTMGAVRVGLIEGNLVINPTLQELENSDLDLVLAGTKDKVSMIEAGAKEISEEKMTEAILLGHGEIKKVVKMQEEIQKKAGKPKKEIKKTEIPEEIVSKVKEAVDGKFEKLFELKIKENQKPYLNELYENVISKFDKESPDFNEAFIKTIFEKQQKEQVREVILSKGKRPDGRKEGDIRNITCEVGILPRTHGSALFTRGQTQSLGVTTLGTGQDEQTIDALEGTKSKRFMLHYNFPSFSVGECRPNRGPGRREIGHGALAERSLEAVIPSSEEFPYTIRLVSDILESNGSSSMATVCAGTLALMDAGVPLKAPVSGIAMGLVVKDNKWRVLTDIAGMEDHLGDMDFKAAGTEKGLTALQMDLKVEGINEEILKDAFKDSKKARLEILKNIKKCLTEPRKELSEFAPRVTALKVNPEKIGEIIGPGGKNIRKLVEETGAKIDIEDDGTVFIAAVDEKASSAAIARIKAIVEEPEIGKIYESEVRKLTTFGAFCEILPGKDGLCHVSEISEGFVKNAGDYLKEGDKVSVKVLSVDERGKVSLSIKQAVPGGIPMLPEDQRQVIKDDPSKSRGRFQDRGRSNKSRRR